MDKIQPSDLWAALDERILIDVRSPSEYAYGHIPKARNLPLFSDVERAKVGTAYKQISPEQALLRGLEFVGPKMSGFVKSAIKWSENRKVIAYCWRGGKRSGSMSWLLKFAGFDVKTIEGGYKNYRHFILNALEQMPLNMIILGGKTGSGKTFVLQALKEQGEQVIDLEGLAHHKGSAFGWIGEPHQPSSEHFDNLLYEVVRQLDPNRRVWVENESRTVGTVFLNQSFWNKMRNAPLIHIEVPLVMRVQHLVDVYTTTSKDDLIKAFQKIPKKLGYENAQKAIAAVQNNDFAQAAAIALGYYDKTYTFGFETKPNTQKHILDIETFDFEKMAQRLKQFADTEGY